MAISTDPFESESNCFKYRSSGNASNCSSLKSRASKLKRDPNMMLPTLWTNAGSRDCNDEDEAIDGADDEAAEPTRRGEKKSADWLEDREFLGLADERGEVEDEMDKDNDVDEDEDTGEEDEAPREPEDDA